MLLILPSACTSAAAQQGDKDVLLAEGDKYAAEGKLIQARDAYERAIASGAAVQNDSVRSHTLGLWYMNAEPHDYAKAAKWLEAALRINPDNQIRLHLAQVLSWNRQFAPAIAQYEQLVRDNPNDRALALQLARVLSWSRQYDQATRAYAEVLKNDPGNTEARVGQAQVLYWSGHADRALIITQEVLKQDPTNASASFLMAALEHNRGRDAQALQWLQHADQDKDTRELRSLISREMRPVLHLGFGFANDREQPIAVMGSTYRTLRYKSSVEFNLTNSFRMELANIVTQNATSTPVLSQFGADSLSTQTVARLHFSLAHWLRISAGAGDGTTGTGTFQGIQAARGHNLIYDVHPVITHGGLRIDLASVRSIADYTPLAIHNNLVQRRESIAAAYTWGKRVRFGSEYWHSDYTIESPDPNFRSFKTSAQGGSASFLPILYSRERFALEAGVRYDIFQFADKTAAVLDPVSGLGSTGIFMPRLYQRYSGTAHISWNPAKRFRMELDGTYGPQRIFGFASLFPPPADFGNTGTFGTRVTIPGARMEPYFGYDFFSTDTPASPGLRQGTFSSHSLFAGLRLYF